MTMIAVRLVFRAKFGHAQDVLALFKAGAQMARAAGGGARHVRILTDLSGPFDTVVQELEFESIEQYMRSQAALFADPRWQQLMHQSAEFIESGAKEYYTVEFDE
jgi:quinol monooxygenase YgiN